jgi:hypothetical protein
MTDSLPRSWSPSQTTARQREIIRLMALGVTMPDIAKQLGNITESAARKLGRRALIAQADDLRAAGSWEAGLALYLTRYEMLLAVWLPKALAGDEKAADLAGKYLVQVGRVSGFESVPREYGPGDDSEPAGADMVAAVLDRLEQLHERLKPPTIDGEVVEQEEEGTPDAPTNEGQPDGPAQPGDVPAVQPVSGPNPIG